MKKIIRKIRYLTEKFLYLIFKVLGFFIPVKNNRILFYSFTGNQYSCSPKYISRYLNEHFPGKFELIWAFRNPEKHFVDYAVKVKYQRLAFFYYHLSAKYIISNIYPYHLIGTKKNQIMIATWHGGGAYKLSGYDYAFVDMKSTAKMLETANKNTSVYLSSSKYFTKYFIGSGSRYTGPVLDTGLPRNDLFYYDKDKKEAVIQRVYDFIHTDREHKLLLYAPTWRSEEDSKDFNLDADKLRSVLKERFGGEWDILTRTHMYTSLNLNGNIIDVKSYPDMQELILACDIIVTDYSSSIWDCCVAEKPCLLYAYDLDKYIGDRNFYVDIFDWGFPICRSFDELISAIRNLEPAEARKSAAAHLKKFGSFENGRASEKVADYILRRMKG